MTERHHAFLSLRLPHIFSNTRHQAWRTPRRGRLRLFAFRALAGAVVLVGIAVMLSGRTAEQGLLLSVVTQSWAETPGEELPVPALVEVSSGTFMMGGNTRNEWQPVHAVTFSTPFYIGRTEVTFGEWDACVADNGCNGHRPADYGWGRETQPAIMISWLDAVAYVEWLSRKLGRSCRLPSEAEWEYAARAGTTTDYALPAPQGSNDLTGKGLANCIGCGSTWDDRQPAPVGSFPANSWGLHDMHGNVWEWVEDCWHGSYDGAPDNGRAWGSENAGDCTEHVVRGGAFDTTLKSGQDGVAVRDHIETSEDYPSLGFRVVCSSSNS